MFHSGFGLKIQHLGWLVFLAAVGCGEGPKEKKDLPKLDQEAVPGDGPGYQTSFGQATLSADNPPPQAPRPFDQTMTKKAGFKVVDEVKKAWPTIRLTGEDGKPNHPKVHLETSEGVIVIEIRPEWAPNHARNFLALVRTGYYDGLRIEKIIQFQTQEGARVAQIEAGCPVGQGNVPAGSLGYWVRDDGPTADGKGDKSPQGEGLVGFCQDSNPDSAATRFFLSTQKLPPNGVGRSFFGQVVQGMEIVRKISVKPVIVFEDEPPGSHSPETPIEIRRAWEDRVAGR